jgi:hypothetical protein
MRDDRDQTTRFVTIADCRYAEAAYRLAKSLHRQVTNARLEVIDVGLGDTDAALLASAGAVVIAPTVIWGLTAPGPPQKALASAAKVGLLASATTHVLYLDADVEIVGDVSHLYSTGLHVMPDAEQALGFYLRRPDGRRRAPLAEVVTRDLPASAWTNYNSGVIAGDSATLRRLADHWAALSRRYWHADPHHHYDQLAFSVAVSRIGGACQSCGSADNGHGTFNFDTRCCDGCRYRRCEAHAPVILHDVGLVRPWC